MRMARILDLRSTQGMQDEKRKLSPVAETLICAVLFLVSAWLGKYVYVTYLILPFIGAYVYARNGIFTKCFKQRHI